ncbi:MAG: MoaD/ThiS family protein [Nanoarchaeota archaeon]|nr:MoaD/ThiS family protein [Nanoarchaeota archaeon]
MKITIERTKETIEKEFSGKAMDLLKEIGVLVEDVLIIKNGQLVTEDEELDDSDEIKLLSVISGG